MKQKYLQNKYRFGRFWLCRMLLWGQNPKLLKIDMYFL